MKYLDEYRDAAGARRLAAEIARRTTRPWTLMEVCGGQTHAIVRFGLDALLPPGLELLHGPGCPVCVTPLACIDQALALAALPDVIFCSFGDMLRVPGTRGDLLSLKAAGADVRVVYAPLDAVRLARQHPDRQVILFAVGFETTAPAHALAVSHAAQLGLENFSLLVSLVLVPPALESLLSSPDRRMQGFLAAGHVCTIMGYEQYEIIAARHQVPIVVTGFEPLDILQGVLMCVAQLEEGRARVENQYSRSVQRGGNRPAQDLLRKVFGVASRPWRGLGVIPQSGLELNETYRRFDALHRFNVAHSTVEPATECVSGLILQGLAKPPQCPAFASRCTPEHPLGPTMVSNEGACAAYYRYRRNGDDRLGQAPGRGRDIQHAHPR